MSGCTFQEKIQLLKEMVKEQFEWSGLSNEALAEKVERLVVQETRGMFFSIDEKVEMVEQILSTFRGFGVLDSLLKDETISEIMVNGATDIFVEKDGFVQRGETCFTSEQELEDTIQKIVGAAGREVNLANPMVDARLADGSRVHVVLAPVALNGPILTIRKFSKEPMSIERLIACGALTEEVAEVLKYLVKAKYNIFISGGTGSGKTTFLNALSHYIPKDERLITIEDSAELQIVGVENLVRLETRNANSAGSGRITIRDLIKSSLRMRPERIIVGEIRGAEALDMLQAMNTGHDGSLSTGHANSTKDMLSRIETMVLTGAEGLPLAAIRSQIASAIDIVIHLSRLRDRSRKVVEISELIGLEDGQVCLNPLFVFQEDASSVLPHVIGQLVRTGNKFQSVGKLEQMGYPLAILEAKRK